MRRENWALLFLVCARLLRFDALSCANVCKENWQELASVDGPKIPLAISHQSVVSGQELRGVTPDEIDGARNLRITCTIDLLLRRKQEFKPDY
jgi:hypothetical protein